MTLTAVERIDQGQALVVVWADGDVARFHAIWLRDNSPDPQTRNPRNGQRLITVLDLPTQITIVDAGVTDHGDLVVTFEPEVKTVVFSADWLRAHSYDDGPPGESGWTDSRLQLWDGRLQNSIPRGVFARIAADREALAHWLSDVRRYGFALLSGVPTGSGDLCRVVDLFGYVRETNYGRWFDVRARVDPDNLADTNLGLQAHTDNPYRDPVPTLQLLSCIENSVEGGESTLVDGFAVAQRLRSENPHGFALLARHCARFEYSGSAGVRLRSRRPMIELQPDGELLAIRFNNRSTATIIDVAYNDMDAYYAAYRQFAQLVEDPAMRVSFRLSPGELFIVDNTRVLHARTAFSGSGTRWLQGCYADKDGLLSTLDAVEAELTQVAAE